MRPPRAWRWLIALLALTAGVGWSLLPDAEAVQAAPSSCPAFGGGPPFSLQSYEGDERRGKFLDALRLASSNELAPGDDDFELPALLVGPERTEDPSAAIPAVLLYAIAWIESTLTQADAAVAYDSQGPTLISFDCGYGVMQVTSTIVNDGGLPSRYEALVASHFAYNIAAGARILAEKWNNELFPSVGERDPAQIESWYYALWAYNGWAAVNHPQDLSNDPYRQPYRCGDDEPRGGYPYQELVLGCVVNPPSRGGQRLWEPVAVALPDLTALGGPGRPLNLEVFFAGLENFYHHPGGDPPPFAEMDMALPSGSVRIGSAAIGDAEGLRRQVLGEPIGRTSETELELSSSQLASGSVPLAIHNDGTGLLAWRIEAAPSWLSLEVDGRVAVGGVAVGADYRPGGRALPSELRIRAAAGGVPEGTHRGRITIAFDLPDGTSPTTTVAISLDKRGAASYEAGRPQS